MKLKDLGSIFFIGVILLGFFSSVCLTYGDDEVDIEIIVGFKGQPDAEMIRQYGGEVHYIYSTISAVFASINKRAMKSLKEDHRISYVDENNDVRALGQTLPWGISHIKAPQAWTKTTGDGVKIAILDTGVGPHQDVIVYGGYDFVNNDNDPSDDNGHGTHVAGTVAAVFNSFGVVGVAPTARIYSVKVLDKNATGKLDWILKGIEWAVNNDMQIISMSWNTSDSQSLHDYMDMSYDRGLLLVAASGNLNNKVAYPAAYDSIIAVAAIYNNNIRYDFSGVGEEVELSAPGVGINSTWSGNSYALKSGTSMATAHVSGVSALVWSKNPRLTNTEVRQILQSSALDLDQTGRDIYYGYGLVDAYSALSLTPEPIEISFTCSPSKLYAGGIVTLNASASQSHYGNIAQYVWNFGDGNNATLNTPIATHAFAATGNYNVTLKIISEHGIINSTSRHIIVFQDDIPPHTIAYYDNSWHTRDITVTLTAADAESGVVETFYRINGGSKKTVRADGQPIIMSESSNNRLEYWSKDYAGNEELANFLIGIKLDKTAPVGSIKINDDMDFTNSTSVILDLTVNDQVSGIYGVRYGNNERLDTVPWEAFSSTKNWILTKGDGIKTVYYQVRDNSGLISLTYSDNIMLDMEPSETNGTPIPTEEPKETTPPPDEIVTNLLCIIGTTAVVIAITILAAILWQRKNS